jgi:flavin-dependent dehydrogenase
MINGSYDVIVVGARCAGASLAVYLARRGAKVLVVDKDPLPSDQVISTHTIHAPGMDVLDELGVGEAVRSVSPAMRMVRLRKNDAYIDVPLSTGRYEYCPRRKRLDGLLQEAAARAGATLLDRTRVSGLLWRDGRVAGIRAFRSANVRHEAAAHDEEWGTRTGERRGAANEQEQVFEAPLVVGADGRYSTVARLVGAREYLGYPGPRGAYWSYWKAPARWSNDAAYPFDMYVANTNVNFRVIFHTDHDHLLIASAPPVASLAAWRANPTEALRRDLAADDTIGPLIDRAKPVEDVRGTVRERYYFRTAAGPGWLLVGDAGHHKDFVIGDGITEALLQVRSLVPAIEAGTDAALQQWWRARDVAALPYYFFAEDEGRPSPPLDLQCLVYSRAASRPDLKKRLALVLDHKLSPYDAFPLFDIIRWTIGGVVKGRPGLVRELLMMSRRGAAVARELSTRKALLKDAASPHVRTLAVSEAWQ